MPEVKEVKKESKSGGGFISFLLALFLGCCVGLAIGRYVVPSEKSSSGTSGTELVRGAVMVERYAPGLAKSIILGSAAVLCTAMISAAYVLKSRK